MYREVGYALYKRAIEDGGNGETPPNVQSPHWWVVLFFLFNIFVLLPIIIIVHYAFKFVYPVLAIIEDESPPAYEPVPLDEDVPPVPGAPKPPNADVVDAPSQPVTSSMRRIHRALKANGGLRSYARGLACMLAQGTATMLGAVLFVNLLRIMHVPFFLGPIVLPVGSFLANLAVIQLSTAWVHIVISKPSPLHFWRRLPDYRRTFYATWRPTAVCSLAGCIAYVVPYLTAIILNIKMTRWDPDEPTKLPGPQGAAWKIVILVLVSFAVAIFVTIPAHVVLIRVQASLLPEEDETIIPFDRSFQGKVEPAVIGGKGYVSMLDAWSTFSNAAWRRLLILYVKVSMVAAAFTFAIVFVVLLPEALLSR